MIRKSTVDFDVIIIGSGPAGVSAAFPLIESGLQVLIVDGGKDSIVSAPVGKFIDIRNSDKEQWEWMLGRNFSGLNQFHATSPKLRVPIHQNVFDAFSSINKVIAKNYTVIGSLASGGLSNSWGAGVACFDENELKDYPFDLKELNESYRCITKRIGVSGGCQDDLSDFFGLDNWAQEPVKIDDLQENILARYTGCREFFHKKGFYLGRSRVAVLSNPMNGRLECDLSGNCLWGCSRNAIYSAKYDLEFLKKHQGFFYESEFVVEKIYLENSIPTIIGNGKGGTRKLRASRLLLAASTLASTRLALQAINYRKPITMESCPTAAFMLWLPKYLGRRHNLAFGLGQLSFLLNLQDGLKGFGSLFNTTGIPVSEFARQMPFGKRYSVDIIKNLLSSCVIGNFFLPGKLTKNILYLDNHDRLILEGNYHEHVDEKMIEVKKRLSSYFKYLGAYLVPGGFQIGKPGSDIHYAASLPMSKYPRYTETDKYGELMGANCIHVIDGACLSSLPAKSHTLTIMANADRISRYIAKII